MPGAPSALLCAALAAAARALDLGAQRGALAPFDDDDDTVVLGKRHLPPRMVQLSDRYRGQTVEQIMKRRKLPSGYHVITHNGVLKLADDYGDMSAPDGESSLDTANDHSLLNDDNTFDYKVPVQQEQESDFEDPSWGSLSVKEREESWKAATPPNSPVNCAPAMYLSSWSERPLHEVLKFSPKALGEDPVEVIFKISSRASKLRQEAWHLKKNQELPVSHVIGELVEYLSAQRVLMACLEQYRTWLQTVG